MNLPADAVSAFRTDLGWMGIVWRAFDPNQEPAAPESLRTRRSVDWLAYRMTFGHFSRKAMLDHLQDLEPGQTEKTLARGRLSGGQSEIVDRLSAYAAGQPLNLSEVPVFISDRTPFQQAVLNACRNVPLGETRTYAELADCAGHPRSARAVGNVMANNRTPLLIPCHRIVPSGGSRGRGKVAPKLGGFTAPGGVTMKQRLLDLESGSQSWLACN